MLFRMRRLPDTQLACALLRTAVTLAADHASQCHTGKQLLLGFTTDGFFAEYAVVDAPNCVHLPESMPVDRAAPIFCAGITAFHAVDSSELKEGDWLAVVGAGEASTAQTIELRH